MSNVVSELLKKLSYVLILFIYLIFFLLTLWVFCVFILWVLCRGFMGFLAAIQWFSTSMFVPVPFLWHLSFSLLVLSYSNVLVFALSHFILFLSLRSPFVFE